MALIALDIMDERIINAKKCLKESGKKNTSDFLTAAKLHISPSDKRNRELFSKSLKQLKKKR